jgi:4-alpha-glucanotransferase
MNTEPLNPWLKERSSGVLAHISALPGRYGIGNLGRSSHAFVDFLAEAGFQHWQICPVGPTGYADSPYQSFSTFAGNPYFIDLDALVDAGWLERSDLRPLTKLPQHFVDFGGLYDRFWLILEKAADRFINNDGGAQLQSAAWHHFVEQQDHWLDAYATFMALKQLHGGKPWTQWQACYRDYLNLPADRLPPEVVAESLRNKVYQHWFFQQWDGLRRYAASKGIGIIGDVPIFVAHDSADVWQNQKVFRIHVDGTLKVAAGVPPDYFSEAGQFWGNPLYDWDYLAKTGYRWWIERMRGSFQLYDVVRLDHFRAFANFWEIPGDAADARAGRWVNGPGMELFAAIHRSLPEIRIIAEDLGYIDQPVYDLRRDTGFPGMKVLQFGFGHDINHANLPHHYGRNCVVYTGTHDNDTTRGWLESLDAAHTGPVSKYFRLDQSTCARPLIHAALASVANLAIVPLQDLLDLDSTARFNTPGTASGNWLWRMRDAQFDSLKEQLGELNELLRLTGRIADGLQHEYSAPPEAAELRPSAS